MFWIAAGALIIKENQVLLVQENSVKLALFRASVKENMDYRVAGPIVVN